MRLQIRVPAGKRPSCKTSGWTKGIIRNYQLYLFILPVLVYFIVFKYVPMYWAQIAFKNYIPVSGIAGSPWVGFAHFERFFNSFEFWRTIRNTLGLSLYLLSVTFPAPIIIALLLNQLNLGWYKRTIQTIIYAPHFISTVVIVGLMVIFLSPRSGIVNHIIVLLGGDSIHFMAEPGWFKTLYVLSEMWQNTGWGTVIYLAALSGISMELHESAVVDGASKLQRIRYIDLPGIMPTAIIILILNSGRIMNIGFEKAFLMQNDLTLSTGQVISTYVYRMGLEHAQYSFSAAVGIFDSVINLILLILVNRISRKLSETSLW